MDAATVIKGPRTGVVVAPAGYGKTSRLVEELAGGLRCLALTHTNVAVANIKGRSGHQPLARVETIDALARRLSVAFPSTTGIEVDCLDWSRIRAGAVAVLQRPAIRNAFAGSYDQVLVDEYQDCSAAQVDLIKTIAGTIPTLVFGDPLQSLYDPLDKGAGLLWDQKVQGWDTVETLAYPWRWDTDPRHRDWVVGARSAIMGGLPVPLNGGTARLLRVADDHGAYLSSVLNSRRGTWAVIIGDSKRPDRPPEIAKRHRRCFMETAELSHPPELEQFADQWDADQQVLAVLQLAKTCISNCGKVTSFNTCLKNAERRIGSRSSSPLARLATELQATRSADASLRIFRLIEGSSETGTYRPDLLSRIKRSLRMLKDPTVNSMADAIQAVQAQVRAGVNRTATGPVIGSVLRLKGLEFDHVAIVEPERFGTREELYVAVSRARHSCTVIATPEDQLTWFS